MFETAKHKKTHAAKDGTTFEEELIMRDVKEAANHFSADVRDAASTIKNDIEAVARQTGKHARELRDSAGHSLTDIGAAMKVKIRDNPVQSSLIALGIGLTLGILYRR